VRAVRGSMITLTDHGLRKERVIVSETQLDSAATGATEPDADPGEADDVSDYSEEADGTDPAGEAEEAAVPVGPALDEAALDEAALDESADGTQEEADGTQEESVDSVREEVQRAFLLRRFERWLGGGRVGVIVTSVSFGLGHKIQGLDAAVATSVLGGFWAFIYLRRRSVVAPVVSHSGFNLLQLAQFLRLGR